MKTPPQAKAGSAPHRPRTKGEELTRRRLRILADLRAGVAPARIAERHDVSRQTVWNVRRAWARGGEAALAVRGEVGRRVALSARFLASLRKALARPVRKGRRPTVWTAEKAAALVARRMGMPVSVVTVRAALRAPEVGLLPAGRVARPAPAAMRREARAANTLVLAAFVEPSPGDPPCLRLVAAGARQPVRAALVRGKGAPGDVAGFLAAVRAEVGRPCRFLMDAREARKVARLVKEWSGVEVVPSTQRARRPLPPSE